MDPESTALLEQLHAILWRGESPSLRFTYVSEQAASLLLRRPKSYDDQVRVTNSVQRILRGIAKRHGLDRRRPRTAINWLEVGR